MTRIRPEQVQEAFDRGGLARAVAAEEAVAAPGADGQAQAVDGIQLAVAADQVFDFDDGRVSVHRIETGKTFNIQHRTPNIQGIPPGNAPLDVRC